MKCVPNIPEVVIKGMLGINEKTWAFFSKLLSKDIKIESIKEFELNELQELLDNNKQIKLIE